MNARIVLALLTAGPLLASCGRSSPRLETRTFALHYLDLWRAQSIVGPYVDSTRPGARGAMSATSGILSVRETADNLDRIGRVLAQFDRPQPTVRLTFKLIRADGAAPPDSAIRDVADVLRSLFRFKGYALVSEGIVTAGTNTRTTQTLAGTGGPYRLTAYLERIAGSGDSATVTLQVQLQARGIDFQTEVGVPAGRTAVLGNVGGGTGAAVLILAVRPDLVAN